MVPLLDRLCKGPFSWSCVCGCACMVYSVEAKGRENWSLGGKKGLWMVYWSSCPKKQRFSVFIVFVSNNHLASSFALGNIVLASLLF